jgi:hypothetical protein
MLSEMRAIRGANSMTDATTDAFPSRRRMGGAEGGVWARPGMSVTFRAELMPGRASAERTFRVTRVLPSRRVLIEGIEGEHAAAEFERKK